MDPLEALAAEEPRLKLDKLTKAVAKMDADEAQTWLDIIDGRTLRPDGAAYSSSHIERAMQRAGHDVSVASIKRRRNTTRQTEER